MRKKINQNILCLLLLIQVSIQIVQADIVSKGTTTKAVFVSKPVVTTTVDAEDCSDEVVKRTFQSCSASSSSSSGKWQDSIGNKA